MAADLGAVDQHRADDRFAIERDPRLAEGEDLADCGVKRLFLIQRLHGERNGRRMAEQQRVDIGGIADDGRAQRGIAHFSVSTRPLTNQRCINSTTVTGGRIAKRAVAMTICHSVWVSPLPIIWRMPMMTVVIDGVLVTSSGH